MNHCTVVQLLRSMLWKNRAQTDKSMKIGTDVGKYMYIYYKAWYQSIYLFYISAILDFKMAAIYNHKNII